MVTSLPRPAVFVLIAYPDGSRHVIEVDAVRLMLSQEADPFDWRGGVAYAPRPEQVTVEGYVRRRVEYAPGAAPDFTPTPQGEIEQARTAVEQ